MMRLLQVVAVVCLLHSLLAARNDTLPRDCSDIIPADESSYDEPHIIQPDGASQPFPALCRFEEGVGWTVLQNHFGSRDEWDEEWREYRNGFGLMSLTSIYWLGLEHMHELTSHAGRQYVLRVDLHEDHYAEYDQFLITDEASNYSIMYHGFSGTAPDGLSREHLGRPFSTKDRRNDNYYDADNSGANCSWKNDNVGWWFNGIRKICAKSLLNQRIPMWADEYHTQVTMQIRAVE